jgi:hypothetical protein
LGVGDWDRISIVDLSGNVIHVAPDPTYANGSRSVDLLILKVTDGIDHPYLPFASILPVEGQNVIVVGNPQGFSGTVSTGIVSGIRDNGNLLQFTAPVSNGSSGCPVLNEDAEVIGLADWVWQPRGSELAENLNFAIGLPVMQTAVANDGKFVADRFNSSPQVAAQGTPSPSSIIPPAPTPQIRQDQAVDFLLGIGAILTNHDYARLSHYLPETTYYFGRRNTTKAWIRNDMENDARTYAWCRTAPDLSTYYEWSDANGNTHQAINEETWEQERAGRLHHAHCRFEIVLNGQTILEFHLTVLPHG